MWHSGSRNWLPTSDPGPSLQDGTLRALEGAGGEHLMPREGLGAGLRPKGHSQPVVTTCRVSLGSYGPPHMATLTMVPCFQGVLGQPLAPPTVPPELGDRTKQRDPAQDGGWTP